MSVLSRPMFNRGGMVHDERTIRNVDDEIYRIAPKTHGGGRQRMDAREEYGRLLREKDYLRGQMNRMANGGGVAAMMDPAMMGGPPMPMGAAPMPMEPPPAAMDNELTAMEQQGMALGADIAMQQEAAIDTADNPKQLIDAMRGNELPLQERYDELATFVGPNDAAITPTSVLALTQPAIIMASEGAVDQGIGNLMEGMTGDVMMDDAMGAAPMGMGVGELMAGSPPPPVPMNTGGAVPKLRTGSSPFETAPMALDLGTLDLGEEAKSTREELREIIGMTDQERALQGSAIYGNMFDRFIALAANKDPRTGEDLEGNFFQKAGQVGQGFLTDVAKARAPEIQRETQLSQIALQDALARRTAQESARYALAQEEAKAAIRGPTQSQLLGLLTADNAKIYAAGTGGPEFDARIQLAIMQAQDPMPVDRFDPILQKTVYDMVPRNLPPIWQAAVEQREGISPQGTGTAPVGAATPDPQNTLIETLASGLDTSFSEEFEDRAINAAPSLFGPGGFLMGEVVSPLQNLFTLRTEGNVDRAAAQRFVDGMKTRITSAYMMAPGLRDSVALRREYLAKIPTPNNPFGSPVDAQYAFQDVADDLLRTVRTEQDAQQSGVYQTAKDYGDSQKTIASVSQELEKLAKLIKVLNQFTGINPIDFSAIDLNPNSAFQSDFNTASGGPRG